MTQTILLIPLINLPQSFSIVLTGITYNLTVKWNDATDAGWVMDIADQNEVPLAANIPFITGDDLLDGLEYLGIEGSFYVADGAGNSSNVPTLINLGTEVFLYFSTSVPNG